MDSGVTLQDALTLPPLERLVFFTKELQARNTIAQERAALPLSLSAYCKAAWPIYKPGNPYLHNWHIDAICEHLEAVTRGQIRNLLITMPPRAMKSSLVSVLWPTWMWTHTPQYQFLYTSYAQTLSIRDALASRRVIQSGWYQARWGEQFQLTGDQNAKTRYDNDMSGYRIASSVGGTATGEGAATVIADDAHNMNEIHSDIIREGVIEWWDQVMSTRLNDPRTGSRIIVMQRGHEADLAGHVLKQGGYEQLSLPMEYELDNRKTIIGWSDPRKKKGELLWPERFGEAEVVSLKAALGPYGTSGQLQQRPAPEEGGIFKRQWFKLWPADVKLPMFDLIIQSYDTAFTEKTTSDSNACTVWGVFKHPKLKHNCVMILDAWDENLDYPALRKRVRGDLHARYGGNPDDVGAPGRRADVVLVEEKGSGIILLQDLRMLQVPAYSYNPAKADKVVRAHAVAAFVYSGRVYMLESSKRPGNPVSWTGKFMHDLLLFPNGQSDDYVDTMTQALLFLRNKELIEAKVGGFEEDKPEQYQEDRVNPYSV